MASLIELLDSSVLKEMKMRAKTRIITLVAALAGMLALHAGLARAADQGTVPTEDQIRAIKEFEFGENREVLSAVDKMIRSVSDSPEKLKAIEQQLLAVMKSDEASYAGKKFVARMLRRMGSEQCVPVLAEMLDDSKEAPLARWVLQRLPYAKIDVVFLDALGQVEGDLKIGVIESLADRRVGKAAPRLAKLATSADEDIARAALSALGRIGSVQAADELQKVDAPDTLQNAWSNACLECAERLLEEGNQSRALAIFEELFEEGPTAVVKIGGLRGIVNARQEDAVPLLLSTLKSDQPQLRAAAAKFIREVPGKGTTRAVAEQLKSLPEDTQVMLIGALAQRGDRAAGAEVTRVARRAEGRVQEAALRALTELGDAGSVEMLAEVAAGKGRAAEVAFESLTHLSADGVDEAIVSLLKDAGNDVQEILIRSLAARGYTRAVPALVEVATDENGAVRKEALDALGDMGGPEMLPQLVELLVEAEKDQRRVAEDAVLAVCQRIKDKSARAEHVISALSEADTEARVSLLRVLGRLGGKQALKAVKSALESDDKQVKTVAVRALAEWPGTGATDVLIEVARNASDATHRVLALRGYIRLAGMKGQRSAKQTVDMFEKAMEMADRAQEKRMILSGLSNVPHVDALRLARSAMDEKGLRAEAQSASLSIARAISGLHSEIALDTLRQIRKNAVQDRVREQAVQAIEAIKRSEDYITGWLVAGPYTEGGKGPEELFNVKFPPEKGGQRVSWRPVPGFTSSSRPWLIDLQHLFGGNNRVAYLKTRIKSPERHKAILELGSDDGVKVWLNGKLVHANNVTRGVNPGEDKVNVVLQKGWNPLMLKITQGGGGWAVCARFRNPAGGEMKGLEEDAR